MMQEHYLASLHCFVKGSYERQSINLFYSEVIFVRRFDFIPDKTL